VNATVDPDSAIGAQARAWALAVTGEDFPPDRSAALAAWLGADPRHLEAYEDAERTLMLLDEALAAPNAVKARSPARPGVARAVWWGASIAAGLVAGAMLATPPTALKSGPSQTREVTLADGSHVTLAPGSSLVPSWRWARRSYVLQRGEAFFAVVHDPAHPFTVTAGEAKVRVLGTRFDVHRKPNARVQVEVEQGLVEVSRKIRGGASVARVAAGQEATADAAGVRAAPLSGAAAGWRNGRLDYAAAPLEDVVADLARYGVFARLDPGVAHLKVTAGLRTDQAEAFVAGLPRVLPVTVVREQGGILLIRPTR